MFAIARYAVERGVIETDGFTRFDDAESAKEYIDHNIKLLEETYSAARNVVPTDDNIRRLRLYYASMRKVDAIDWYNRSRDVITLMVEHWVEEWAKDRVKFCKEMIR